MERFSIRLTNSATNDLDNTDGREQIIADLRTLYDNPLPTSTNIKKLKGFSPSLYRLRSGNWRVLYRIEGLVVVVMRVINRKELERTIKRIKKTVK